MVNSPVLHKDVFFLVWYIHVISVRVGFLMNLVIEIFMICQLAYGLLINKYTLYH